MKETKIAFVNFVNIISPDNDMTQKLKMLLSDFPNVDPAAMGFPHNWEEEPVWKQPNSDTRRCKRVGDTPLQSRKNNITASASPATGISPY